MASLQVPSGDYSSQKHKAVQDAKKMEASVHEECSKSGKPFPAYHLNELIGKGSYGRVYKATDTNTSKIVAVKIIDVDESDSVTPHLSDTYSEFLKEINALQLLSEGGAQNINHVLEALPVGRAMWMVTEYCAGGSVATLMRPTAPGGLQEKWIIPILREVCVAIFWVHKAGIIHRDIKSANVLVTEEGAVQLCDFGVAGISENKFDKRSTVIGTMHWMAPELFNQNPQYGCEVDIWAFGSMVYEIASGLPPNVSAHHPRDLSNFGNFLKNHIPRLEGDQYSAELKSLVAYCLEEAPEKRPTIEQVQKHPYIHNTGAKYPTSALVNLVKAYKLWEERGGARRSLFNAGGAQGPVEPESTTLVADGWNFSTTLAFDERIHEHPDGPSEAEVVRDVYGTDVDFPRLEGETTPRAKAKGRRRPPPQALAAIKAPLEKVFDPNTISNYSENSQRYYGREMPSAASDLPLRDDSLHATLRESLIDLDASMNGIEPSKFSDMETIKAGPGPRASMDNEWSFSGAGTIDRAPLSDPADLNNGRHGPNWRWPTTIPPPASANPELSHFAFNDGPSPDYGARPPLLHHPTEPVGLPSQGYDLQVPRGTNDRLSVSSLIDLDMSMPDPALPELTRPSTANSEAASVSGSELGGGGPFELERHTSVYAPHPLANREPSIYVSDDSPFAAQVAKNAGNTPDIPEIGTMSTEQTIRIQQNGRTLSDLSQTYLNPDDESQYSGRSQLGIGGQRSLAGGGADGMLPLPPVAPPAANVMEARATSGEVANEMRRLIGSLGEHLSIIGNQVGAMEPRRGGQRLSGAGQGAAMMDGED